jgi:hypothetical protein
MLDTIVELSITQDYDPKFEDTTSIEYNNFANKLQKEVNFELRFHELML